MKIKILNAPEYKKGSARAKWFSAIKRYDGTDVEGFVKNTEKRPPVLTKSGEPEPAAGWIRYFVREEASNWFSVSVSSGGVCNRGQR